MPSHASSRTIRRTRQRGTTLLESLIAFILLSLGTVAVVQLQGALRLHADVARQRSEAVRLGERELESLRAFSVLAAASGASAYASIVDAATVVDGSSGQIGNTAYRIVRHVDDGVTEGGKSLSVSVEWADRGGAPQRVALDSVIARNDPVYSGALSVPAPPRRGVHGRSARIPVNAKSLGDGRSAWKPAPGGTIAVVFDDATGSIVSRCTGVTSTTSALTSGDLSACTPGGWLLLSGTIRFTSATPPLPAGASDTPLPVAASLGLSGGTYATAPECSVDAMKTVRYSIGGSLHLEAIPIGAEPASLGVSSWDDTGDRYTSYRCLVTPRADGRWSGRTTLVPSGWTIGTGATDHRVCRFSSDLDGSGAIDANIEHPAAYVDVDGALTEQNFLVVPGGESCPAAAAGDPLTAALATVQQQP